MANSARIAAIILTTVLSVVSIIGIRFKTGDHEFRSLDVEEKSPLRF
jgi:hypothetical protein